MATPTPNSPTIDISLQRLSSAARPVKPTALSASLTIAWRAMLKIKHNPMLLFDLFLLPIIITLLFSFIFGGALAGSIEGYLQQLIPGIMVLSVTMISQHIAMGLNKDIEKGLFDRFRSLAMWRPAVIVGALLTDLLRYTITVLVVVMLGIALGFRPEAGVRGILLALGLLLIFAFALSWIWTTLGLLISEPESLSIMSSITVFPLTFFSNLFVDPITMPTAMQRLVNLNPISIVITAMRGIVHGTILPIQIVSVFIACAALITLFAPMTMYLYNNKNRA
ncbi:MAG: ABC transporter permease [Chloroflexota bacterium]